MNIKMMSLISVLALSSVVFAEETPATETVDATPVETVTSTESAAPAEVSAPAEENAAAPAESVIFIDQTKSENAAAPVAVRDGQVPAEPAPVAAPAPSSQNTGNTVVYTQEPTAVRQDAAPVTTIYVEQSQVPAKMTTDELRGLVPLHLSVGLQAFIGSYTMVGDNWDDENSYDGMTWRAGVFGVVPLNEYTIAVKLGILFEQSDARSSYRKYLDNKSVYDVKVKFNQRKIDIPMMFAFKASTSSLMFNLGVQASIPVMDEFKVTFEDRSSKVDMMDAEFRSSIDWSLVFGFDIRANKYVSFDLRADCGFSQMYDAMRDWNVDDLTSLAFLLGVSFYVF